MASGHPSMTISAALLLLAIPPLSANAEPPDIQTPAPVIHLADNLDEADDLGWCIDTLGRGFAEQLQAHSCKPEGGDVQFYYDAESRQIISAEYAGKCATLHDTAAIGVTFDLLDCVADDGAQRFAYETETLTFHPEGHDDFCIAVGPTSRSAGPFMSRTLELANCAETAPELLQWIIVGDGPSQP